MDYETSLLPKVFLSNYNSCLGKIIKNHNISYHFYADDGFQSYSWTPSKNKMVNFAKDG